MTQLNKISNGMSKIKKTNSKPQKTLPAGRQGFIYYLGNLLIISSLLMSFLIFYPVISTYLFPKPITKTENLKGDYITIPKIKAQAPLILNVDPWKENIYQKALKKGVAHAKGTPLPGEKGRAFIFAHSSGNPLDIISYNTVFLKLGELKIGDIIEIKRKGKIYKYSVTQVKIVWPNEVDYLKNTKSDGIIVQTCWPIGTAFKRLLVFAAFQQ